MNPTQLQLETAVENYIQRLLGFTAARKAKSRPASHEAIPKLREMDPILNHYKAKSLHRLSHLVIEYGIEIHIDLRKRQHDPYNMKHDYAWDSINRCREEVIAEMMIIRINENCLE